jgi:hypothetical protein
MNKVTIYVLIGFLVWSAVLTGCSEGGKREKPSVERAVNRYKCPMGCTGQIFDKPGKCPKCGIERIKITEG